VHFIQVQLVFSDHLSYVTDLISISVKWELSIREYTRKSMIIC